MKNVVGIFFRYKLTIIQIIYSQNSILFYNNKIFSPTMKTTALLTRPWGMCIDPKEYICFHCSLGALYDSKIHPWKLARSLFQSLSILWEPNSISTFPYPRDDCEVLRKLMQQQRFFNLRTIPETLATYFSNIAIESYFWTYKQRWYPKYLSPDQNMCSPVTMNAALKSWGGCISNRKPTCVTSSTSVTEIFSINKELLFRLLYITVLLYM